MSKYVEDKELSTWCGDYFELVQKVSNLEKEILDLTRRKREMCVQIEEKLAKEGHVGLQYYGQNYVVVTRKQAKYLLPVQERKNTYKETTK